MTPARAVTQVALTIFAGVVLIVSARRPGSDFEVYVASGEAMLQKKDIYRAPLPRLNTGPPFFTVLCVVPALLDRVSPTFARGAWTVVNYAALLILLGMASRLLHGRRLPVASAPILVPFLLTLPYLLYHFQYHQVNLIVFALALGGLVLQEKGRDGIGGLLLGAAAALKVMPILFLPYLLYRRRWYAATSTATAALAFTLSPGLIMGWRRLAESLHYWWTLLPRNPAWDAGHRNQSVLAMWDRFLGHGCVPLLSPGVTTLPMSEALIVRLAWLATIAVTSLLLLLSFRGRPKRGSLDVVIEWSAVFVVSAIFGPVGWKHYLVVLLLPNLLLWKLGHESSDPGVRRASTVTLWGCFLINFAAGHLLWGSAWCMRLGMASCTTIATLILLGTLMWVRRRFPQEEKLIEGPATG
jgi:hypothetical protein